MIESKENPLRHLQEQGTLMEGSFYVERAADAELEAALRNGAICQVFGPRQLGKSSLCSNIARKLSRQTDTAAQQILTVYVDLTLLGIGDSTTDVAAWYHDLIHAIGIRLKIPSEQTESFWKRHQKHSLAQRWALFLREVVLQRFTEQIVLLFDEIDVIHTLPFYVDDFFGIVRQAYNERTVDEAYRRLSWCFIGGARPSELLSSSSAVPFDVGRDIMLADFSLEEVSKYGPQLQELLPAAEDQQLLMDKIFEWTSGHPYMTARLCFELLRIQSLRHPCPPDAALSALNELVLMIFLHNGRITDPNLGYAEKRVNSLLATASKENIAARLPRSMRSNLATPTRVDIEALLRLYQRVLQGEKVPAKVLDPEQNELRISGLCRWEDNKFVVRNAIFKRVFDLQWVKSKMSERLLDTSVAHYKTSMELGKVTSALLTGQFLLDAQLWAVGRVLSDDEKELLSASARAAEKRRSWLWGSVIFVGAISLLAVAVAVVLYLKNSALAKERDTAQQEQSEAVVRLDQASRQRNELIERLRGHLLTQLEQSQLRHEPTSGEIDALRKVATTTKDPQQRELLTKLESNQKVRDADPQQLRQQLDKLLSPPDCPPASWPLPHLDKVHIVAHSRQGTALVTGGQNGQAWHWNAASGQLLSRFSGHKTAVRIAVISEDGQHVATAGGEPGIRLWDIPLSDASRETFLGTRAAEWGEVHAAALSPDGKLLATAESNRLVRIWSWYKDKPILDLRDLPSPVGALTFSEDGEVLAMGGDDPTVRLWDPRSGERKGVLKGGPGKSYFVAFAGGKSGPLIVCGGTHVPRVLELESSAGEYAEHVLRKGPEGTCLTLAQIKNQFYLAIEGTDGNLLIWNPIKDDVAQTIEHEKDAGVKTITGAAFSAGGDYLVTASDDLTVRRWQLALRPSP